MKRTFVLTNVAYATATDASAIVSIADVHKLAPGSAAVFLDGKLVSAVGDIPEELKGGKITVAVGYASGTRMTPRIPIANFRNGSKTLYKAPVPAIIELTDIKDTIGEAVIKLYNKSLQGVYSIDRFIVSKTRKEGETLTAFLERFVESADTSVIEAGFQKQNNLIANVEVITGVNPGLRFTAVDPSIALEISKDGIFEDATITVTQEREGGFGVGEDVVKDEQETTPLYGDSGFEDNEYFNRAGNASATVTYDALNISYLLLHQRAMLEENSMIEDLTIYGKVGAQFNLLESVLDALGGMEVKPKDEDGTVEGGD